MRRNTLIAIVVSSSIIVIGLIAIVLVLLAQGQGAGPEESSSATEVTLEQASERVRSPWADMEREAVQSVTRKRVGDRTILQRIQSGVLANNVDYFRSLAGGEEEAQWVASQIDGSSLYTVTWRYRLGRASVGPRWLVQVNPDGPEALSGGRVVAANALAELVEHDDPASVRRYYNRGDEVLRALTNHSFDGGLRLGSALLVHFFGGDQTFEGFQEQMLGWVVAPERIEPEDTILYVVHLQWNDGEEIREAQWEVNLADSSFQPRNLLAYDLMRGVSAITDAQIQQMQMPRVDGEPMDLTTPPAQERSEARRALRWVLHDPRVAEAVAVLLGYLRSQGEITDRGWRVRPGDQPALWDVQYVFVQGGSERSLNWRVNARTGQVEPVSDIARVTAYFLNLDGGGARN